jgi:hypothetical protein
MMQYRSSRDVICFGDGGEGGPEQLLNAKQAAIYYDRVWPLRPTHYYFRYGLRCFKFRDFLPLPVQADLLPRGGYEVAFAGTLGEFVSRLEAQKRRIDDSQPVTPEMQIEADKDLLRHYFDGTFIPRERCRMGCCELSRGETLRHLVLRHAREMGLRAPTLLLPPSWPSAKQARTGGDVCLSLARLNLIDVRRATWQQILDFRRDPESRRRLRRLRLFLHANYTGKSLHFMEDDLGRRLDDYRSACMDHGFETVTSVITMITSSKNIRTMGAATLIALLAGEPIAATVAAGVGAAFEVADVSVELARRSYQFRKIERDHDLAYLIHARKKLGRE